jgi:hypothetical protein
MGEFPHPDFSQCPAMTGRTIACTFPPVDPYPYPTITQSRIAVSLVKQLIPYCLLTAVSLTAHANSTEPKTRPAPPARTLSAPSERVISRVEELYIDATGDAPLVRMPSVPLEDGPSTRSFSSTTLGTEYLAPALKTPMPSVMPAKRFAPAPPDLYVDATDGGPVTSNTPPDDTHPRRPIEDFSPRSQSVVLEDNPMALYFELTPTAEPLQGSLLRGKGFRVWADWRSSSNATLRFYFQQMYRGLPLNDWSGGHGYPGDYEKAVSLDLPTPDGQVHRVFLQYDLRSIYVTVSNSTQRISEYGLWRDNMTENLGTDGPDQVAVDHSAVANVSYVPAEARPSRYIWEGVLGNTSLAPAGPSVHSPWWPISKMISRGRDVFFTGGYI